jgi:hypothetical protein
MLSASSPTCCSTLLLLVTRESDADHDPVTRKDGLLTSTLVHVCSAMEALTHEFFDELRIEGARLPNGKPMPELFNFTKGGEL